MLANKAKATNYHILFPLVCPNIPLNLSFSDVSGPATDSAGRYKYYVSLDISYQV
jgi:hypothetical protein